MVRCQAVWQKVDHATLTQFSSRANVVERGKAIRRSVVPPRSRSVIRAGEREMKVTVGGVFHAESGFDESKWRRRANHSSTAMTTHDNCDMFAPPTED